MVRKDSKSLKVFIGFIGDIYLQLTEREYRLYRDDGWLNLKGKKY